jgi:peptidoglycan/xylan/chitin deacetylase (PgdA/CDA1 family)
MWRPPTRAYRARQHHGANTTEWSGTVWPDGKRSGFVMSFDFDAEEVWIGEDPANAGRPGVLSQGTYGPKVAVPALLKLLDKHGVRASFYVPGRDAERHPDSVRSIIAAGHEVGHHGYTHTSPASLTPEQEEEELVLGLRVLEDLGATVVGYRSPSWEFSPITLPLLAKHGFLYSTNMMDDIVPYRHTEHDLVELPVHWVLDDAPHFWFDGASWNKTIRLPREVRELWEGEVAGIREMGGLAMLTTHPQIIGRPGRIGMLDDFLDWVTSQPDVWVGTGRDVAELVA